MKFDCPHCLKEIFIEVKTKKPIDPIEHEVAKRTKELRDALVRAKKELKEIKKDQK